MIKAVLSLAAFSALTLSSPCLAVPDTTINLSPTPRSISSQKGQLRLSSGVQIQSGPGVKAGELEQLRLILKQAKVPVKSDSPVRLSLHISPPSESAKPALKQNTQLSASALYPVPGAHRISITPGSIQLTAIDSPGLFYSLQSLRQLISPQSTLPLLQLSDYPELPFRGTVEGFYGKPWSHRDRLSQLAFYGENKLNTYIYGPKDDPYHSSPHWRKPYPEKEAGHIRELCQTANKNHVHFYWAIHPGKDIRWNQEDELALLKKFEAMYQLGVRSFAVFFDDISGRGTDPKRQADLLNRIHREFILVKKDVSPLIMCPTQYNKAWADPKPGSYLDILGDTLDPSIHVMWTGDSVVADITQDTMQWINRRLKRKTFVWWNFPVSDYVRDHLLLGPSYGLDPEAGALISGFSSNPMDKPEASKIALYGVADYCWNPLAYQHQRAWLNGLKAVIPEAARDAYHTFARHNSDLGPNYHRYRRAESVEITPAAHRYLSDYRQSPNALPKDFETINAEFSRIHSAPETIRHHLDNPALLTEITPWLSQFELLGKAGQSTLEMTRQLVEQQLPNAWKAYLETDRSLAAMLHNDRTLNQNPYQPGVKTASLVLTPMLHQLHQLNAGSLYSQLSGRAMLRLSAFSSFKDNKGIDQMIDGNDSSYFFSRQIQQVGDHVGIDLGTLSDIKEVRILQGENNQDHDIIHQGQLEYSSDLIHWQALGPLTSGHLIHYHGSAVNARYLRYRVTHAGKIDGSKPDVWTRIRSFECNPDHQPKITSNQEELARAIIQVKGNQTQISPVYEVIKIKKGQWVGIDLTRPGSIAQVTIDLKNETAAKQGSLESSDDGVNWSPLATTTNGGTISARPQHKARIIRWINRSSADQSITLSQFVLTSRTESSLTCGAFNDRKLSSYHTLDQNPLEVRNELGKKARQLILLTSSSQPIQVTAHDGQGHSRLLGTIQEPYSRLALDKLPVHSVTLKCPTGKTRVHEVIWSTKPSH